MLYASDHPWVDAKLITDCIRKMKRPAADEHGIFAANAEKLFQL